MGNENIGAYTLRNKISKTHRRLLSTDAYIQIGAYLPDFTVLYLMSLYKTSDNLLQ